MYTEFTQPKLLSYGESLLAHEFSGTLFGFFFIGYSNREVVKLVGHKYLTGHSCVLC